LFIVPAQCLGYTAKKFLYQYVIQLYAGEYTPSVDRALKPMNFPYVRNPKGKK